MKTIAILGANSQVGTEVCLHLDAMKDVDVVPVCRTEPATAFLRQCGLECRVGTLSSVDQARDLLAGCDAVVEFSRPSGEPAEIVASTRKIVRHALEAAPVKARYVFISSIMAFGMEQNSGARRVRFIARTVYGRTKRNVERFARRLGRKTGREVYVLRLGDVHGELQSVSRAVSSQIRLAETWVPAGPSYTVFAHSIAEGLRNISYGKEAPGTYTFVNEPELSWKELHEYYCCRVGVQPVIEEFVPEPAKWRPLRGPLAMVLRRRELIAAYMLYYFPRMTGRIRTGHSRRRAVAQIGEMNRARQFRPYQPTFLGRIPGNRLKSVSDGRSYVETATRIVKRYGDVVSDACRIQEASRSK